MRWFSRLTGATLLAAGVFALGNEVAAQEKVKLGKIPPPPEVVQFKTPQLTAELVEASEFIRVIRARSDFKVTGKGFTAAVLDTGLRTTHVDFKGRVPAKRNFTGEGGGEDDVTDKDGHGTNVAGIVAANDLHVGIAPGANVIPLKVLGKNGGSFEDIARALDWVLENHKKFNITVVNMSLGDTGNYTKEPAFDGGDPLRDKVKALRKANIAVVVAAGNDYFKFSPLGGTARQGMSYPGIIRETVSVGAVFDAFDQDGFEYASGAVAHSTRPGALTPFSQRLHYKINQGTRTDILAPGAPLRSSGSLTDKGESVQHGTSQASPVTAGVILLMQEYHFRETGKLPSVDNLEKWLRNGSVTIRDGDDEDDNVAHTNLTFPRIDALSALQSVQRGLTRQLLMEKTPLKGGM
jgi:subtilisin family serine protease